MQGVGGRISTRLPRAAVRRQREWTFGPRGRASQRGKRARAPPNSRARAPSTCSAHGLHPASCREAGPPPCARRRAGLGPQPGAGRSQAGLAGRHPARERARTPGRWDAAPARPAQHGGGSGSGPGARSLRAPPAGRTGWAGGGESRA